MKRRTVVFRGAAMIGSTMATLPSARLGQAQTPAKPVNEWSVPSLSSGGTAELPTGLPAPTFLREPNCIVTLEKMLGPCQINNVPIRYDVTEGVTGLPVQIGLRIVDATDCGPIEGADVEIWQANVRGVYSGRAASMCNPGDAAAQNAGFLRGRQISDGDGVVRFLTVYPGWYGGRAPHIHLRVLVGGRETLISQLLFDDTLSNRVYGEHPDYVGRPRRDTMNQNDFVFSPAEVDRFTFDVETLEIGILQASFTIGLSPLV